MENMQGDAEKCVLNKACLSHVGIIGLNKGSKVMNESKPRHVGQQRHCRDFTIAKFVY